MDPNQQLSTLQLQIQQLQSQMAQIQGEKAQLSSALHQANQSSTDLQLKLHTQGSSRGMNKAFMIIRKPKPFRGKGSIQSWVVHMDNYVSHATVDKKLAIAVSFLEGNAHEWWIVHSTMEAEHNVHTWEQLKQALLKRFQPLNKTKIARDRLAK